MIKIAIITKAHGIKGEVKVVPFYQETELIKRGIILYIENKGQNYSPLEIESVRTIQKDYLVKFKNSETRNDAEELKNLILFYPKKLLPKLPDDEFYKFEIIGKRAFFKDKLLGTISGFMGEGQSEIAIIENESRELLVPFVSEFISHYDRKNELFYFKNMDNLL